MAHIENRSKFKVSVQNRDDLTKTFAHHTKKAAQDYFESLRQQGFKPKVTRLNDRFVARVRTQGFLDVTFTFSTEQEVRDAVVRIELERKQGLFTDYNASRRVTFASLLERYLREESPRHKGFAIEGYNINAILADAGLPRVDLAQAYSEHPNPCDALAGVTFSESTGRVIREHTPASCFILKKFADVLPTDFKAYSDARCKQASPATVDRELDIFSAVCHIAIDTWRIAIAKNPFDGVKRPKYHNERDRRLKGDEEERMLDAAYEEDARLSIRQYLEELIGDDRASTKEEGTTTYEAPRVLRRLQLLRRWSHEQVEQVLT